MEDKMKTRAEAFADRDRNMEILKTGIEKCKDFDERINKAVQMLADLVKDTGFNCINIKFISSRYDGELIPDHAIFPSEDAIVAWKGSSEELLNSRMWICGYGHINPDEKEEDDEVQEA